MSSACILCPIDFSDSSRAALGYADALAEHFGARLILLSVDDPLLAEAAGAGLASPLTEDTLQELHRFSASAISNATGAAQVARCVRTGKPSVEILREARASASDLIVMSSRGQTGIRKRFFGSTTERVLRETPVPVLVTPTHQPPGPTLDDIAGHIYRIVVPVDLTAASERHLRIAAGIATALGVPLLVAHVVEPITISQRVRQQVTGVDALRRSQAEHALDTLVATIPKPVKFETMILSGDPAEEIAKTAETRRANLIIMGLNSSAVTGPRMGAVTYRVLSLTRRLVLALPPSRASSAA